MPNFRFQSPNKPVTSAVIHHGISLGLGIALGFGTWDLGFSK
jgi:hypothetical protein